MLHWTHIVAQCSYVSGTSQWVFLFALVGAVRHRMCSAAVVQSSRGWRHFKLFLVFSSILVELTWVISLSSSVLTSGEGWTLAMCQLSVEISTKSWLPHSLPVLLQAWRLYKWSQSIVWPSSDWCLPIDPSQIRRDRRRCGRGSACWVSVCWTFAWETAWPNVICWLKVDSCLASSLKSCSSFLWSSY